MAEVVTITNLLGERPVPELAYQLRLVLPPVAENFTTVAAVVSADFYDKSRNRAPEVQTEYKAEPKIPDINVAMNAAIGFGMAQLTKEVPFNTFQSTLAGSMQRLVLDGDRETMQFNIVTDPDGTTYERVPSPGACAFCVTMAAVAEVQRDEYFEGYHNFCRCTLNPIFTGQDRTVLPEYEQAQKAYSLASAELEKQNAIARKAFSDQLKAEGKPSSGRAVGTAFRKTYPELSGTTKNRLRLIREITGQK